EIARIAAGGRLHGARAGPGPGHDRRQGGRPARDGFVNRPGGQSARPSWGADPGEHRLRRRDRRGGGDQRWGGGDGGGGEGRRGGGRLDGRGGRRRFILHADRLLDPVHEADPGRFGFRLGRRRRFRLRLGDDDAFPGPFQEPSAGTAKRVAVLVMMPALLADDHSLVTSTTSLTSARLTTSTLCVTCAGLAAATSPLRRPALTVVGSSTVTRTSSAKLGEPGSAAPAAVEVAIPPVSWSSIVPPVSNSSWACRPPAVPRIR